MNDVYCKIKMYKVASEKCTKLQVQNVQSCKYKIHNITKNPLQA